MFAQRQRILTVYSYVLCIVLATVVYSLFTAKYSAVANSGSSSTVCLYSTLKYELTPYSIVGDVVSDITDIFVLLVDDVMPPVTSEYVIENGILQGKFMRGSKWVVPVDKFYTFPGAIYIVGVYNNNQCFTSPIYINLPLNSYILGNDVSFEALYVMEDGKKSIIMRGNTVMETQYYLLLKDSETFILDNELFQDDNYVGLGKLGRYFSYPMDAVSASFHFAYVGCRVENSKSRIFEINLDRPVIYNSPNPNPVSTFTIDAHFVQRNRPNPVDAKKNSGNLGSEVSRIHAGSGGNSPIRIRQVQTMHNVVFVRCLLMNGPYDVYYMVRPESKERGEPDERTVMRYGEQAGQFQDTSFDLVVTDYVSSVKNIIYVVAVKGKTILGPTKRGFFP